jgi:transcriptional regulator with XRE-family HTH domain
MLAPGYARDEPAGNALDIRVDQAEKLANPGLSPSLLPGLQGRITDNNPAVTIGGRIRTLRRARGLTQDTLAVSTGVSRSAVAQWETGRAGQMGGKLRRIAEALGVSVSMLKEGWEGLATDSVLSAEEMSLLRLFRRCPAEDRMVLMHVAQKLAANPAAEADTGA